MFSRFRSTPEQRALVERLQQEARQSRPAFSESLHERICRSLRSPPAPPPPRSGKRPSQFTLAALAVAVLVGISAAVTWYRAAPQPGFTERDLAGLALLPESVDRGMQEVGQLASLMAASGPWANLEHDVRLALASVAEAFPLGPGKSRLPGGTKGQEPRPAGGTH